MHLKIDEGFPTHPKTLRFGRLMQNPEAPWFLLRLWTWACRSAPDGNLDEMEAYDIEQAINYRPLDGKCYRAMVEAGFIDEGADGTRRIHNWLERTGGDIVKMEAEADRKRMERLHRARQCQGAAGGCPACLRETSRGRPSDVGRTEDGRPEEKPTQSSPVKARQDQASPDPEPESSHTPARDPGGPATDPEPDAAPPPPPLRPPALATASGHDLLSWYGEERAKAVEGAQPWRTPAPSGGKASTFAEALPPEDLALVRQTMAAHFEELRRGLGKSGALESPTFGFSCWMADFTRLVEKLRGVTPVRPPASRGEGPARAAADDGSCGFHAGGRNTGRHAPRELVRDSCAECRHMRARGRPKTAHTTQPSGLDDVLASIEKRVPAAKGWGP